ncbi:recombinase family protein [Streptomyces erythrochromogenes]|uniref:recombinase family protein n=1 Tax=Streptomyces erythrochromogenes TaxID=285574 RepID=UPI0037F6CE27
MPTITLRVKGVVVREDHATLARLGFGLPELVAMGLDQPATADPPGLMDVYLRRSEKKEDVATLRGHLRDVANWAKAGGLEIRNVWFEQLSASKGHVRRPEFEKATRAVLDGKSQTLGVWRADRFDRRGMGAVGRMLDEFDRRQARLVSVSEGLDSATGGRIVFAILSEQAREEAKDIAKRVKTGHDAHKADGRRGTGRPPFGLYSAPGSGKVEHHRDEFETARRLADLLLGGETTKRTAHRLNEEGRRTRSGATWSPTAVSKLAQSPLFAGMVPVRKRKTDGHGNLLDVWEGYGEPLRDGTGDVVLCGTGVVSPTEWFTIRSLIAERTDNRWSKGKAEAKYLGTGNYRCGRLRDKKGAGELELCGGSMSHRGGRYRCVVRETRGTSVCKGVVTLADRIDHAVGQAWVNHIAALEPNDPVITEIARRWLAFSDPEKQARKREAQKALEAAQARVEKLEADFYVYGRMDEERFEELGEGLRLVIEEMAAALEGMDAEADLAAGMQLEHLQRAWEEAEMADRRRLLKCALGEKGITVKPAVRQGDPTPILERVEFDWLSKAQ